MEQLCLAVVWSIMKCRSHLPFRKFTIATDHSALLWLLNLRLPAGCLTRWSLLVQEYDFDAMHKPGISHRVPDALSRLSTNGSETEPLPPEAQTKCLIGLNDSWSVDVDRVLKEQVADPWIQWAIKQGLLFKTEQGLAYKRHPSGFNQLAIPGSLFQEVMQMHHEAPSMGHPGSTRMYFTTSRRYYWQSKHLDIIQYVTRCESCRRNRHRRPRRQADMVIRTSFTPRWTFWDLSLNPSETISFFWSSLTLTPKRCVIFQCGLAQHHRWPRNSWNIGVQFTGYPGGC